MAGNSVGSGPLPSNLSRQFHHGLGASRSQTGEPGRWGQAYMRCKLACRQPTR